MKVDQLDLIKSSSPQEASTLPRVLVAGAGGPSGVAAIGALDGETLDIFSADIDPNAPGLNLVDEDRRLPVAKGYGDSYTELLFELCEDHRIDVLVPAMGSELLLLASARAFFVKETAGGEPVLLEVSPYFRDAAAGTREWREHAETLRRWRSRR